MDFDCHLRPSHAIELMRTVGLEVCTRDFTVVQTQSGQPRLIWIPTV